VTKVVARRQARQWRILLAALVLFPVVFNYLSPYLILDASSRGIINGSLLVFGLLTLSSLVIGRAWCGWLCPAGALGEVWARAKRRPARGGRWNATKWAIWVPWLGLIAFFAIAADGYHAVDPLYNTEHGVSVSSLPSLVILCGVLLLISVFSLTAGRRGFCHYACWMAPFLILGRKAQRAAPWPALHLEARREACTRCGACTKACPMSLDVRDMVAKGLMENAECALCLTCADACPFGVIREAWSPARPGRAGRRPSLSDTVSQASSVVDCARSSHPRRHSAEGTLGTGDPTRRDDALLPRTLTGLEGQRHILTGHGRPFPLPKPAAAGKPGRQRPSWTGQEKQDTLAQEKPRAGLPVTQYWRGMSDPKDTKRTPAAGPDPMGACLDSFPDQCREAIEIVRRAPPLPVERVSRVVVCGMGGSGMAGRLAERFSELPIVAHRSDGLPAWVDQDTLVIAVSYSGDTAESLSAFSAAIERGAAVWAISSGGALKSAAKRFGVPFVEIPRGLQPRAALGYLALPCLAALVSAGALAAVGPWEALFESLEDVRSRCGTAAPADSNPAWELAAAFRGHVPLIYGTTGNTDVVAERWKTQINENAKQAAFWNVFPELGHNEIATLEQPELLRDYAIVLLRNGTDTAVNAARVEATKELLSEAHVAFHEVWAEGETPLAQVFSQIYLGDYTSYYLALSTGVDPTPVRLIQRFKQRTMELARNRH